ncbi:hypothetical protein [Burkholderia cepacia]|uniref:hypothetical protein n=1 Tax=Burkholderia cepacia TaxID=292 RepID=UPI000F602DD2|nr:hypothetical protein [Burkholderia cepacia]
MSTSLPSSVPGEPDGTRKRHARCVLQAAGRRQPAGLLRRPRPVWRRPVSGYASTQNVATVFFIGAL